MEDKFNVVKMVENTVEVVLTLEIPDLYFNKLAISNSYLVKATSRSFPSKSLSIWSLTTGDLVKQIDFPLPFPLKVPSLSGILLSYNHLIVRVAYDCCCSRKQLILMFHMEELVNQSKVKPRRHFIVEDFHRFGDSLDSGCFLISRNNTKLLISDEFGGDIMFYSWDFWKSSISKKERKIDIKKLEREKK